MVFHFGGIGVVMVMVSVFMIVTIMVVIIIRTAASTSGENSGRSEQGNKFCFHCFHYNLSD
ncbi:hypothetical protein SAMN05421740_10112 [Parapedobacter koreensis]|uniref:Uncharacterized protein n=2 Tax=Parapedobacter koreensis TaxID=332977 RepID=A0A1H7EVJ0_9SPHI|nr:hypothetical protein SAMN05421740_10112 [Parapedobacter koreensis]